MEWLAEWVPWIVLGGWALITGWLGVDKARRGRRDAQMEADLSLQNAQSALRDRSKVKEALNETEDQVADGVAAADDDRVRWLQEQLDEDRAALGSGDPKGG